MPLALCFSARRATSVPDSQEPSTPTPAPRRQQSPRTPDNLYFPDDTGNPGDPDDDGNPGDPGDDGDPGNDGDFNGNEGADNNDLPPNPITALAQARPNHGRTLLGAQSSPKPSNSSGSKSTPSSSNNSGSASTSGQAKSSRPAQPDLSKKLGKDGKLTSDERKRRFDLKLCMFCGDAGHMAKDCPKSTSRAAKARAAITVATPEPKPEASSEAKK
ncbi:hypothetical protein HYDPIDRAFT_33467 [Hydnomerulius pinastri MD-312]|uniref:CCHC-type domain-containing protein n=1 Tax=Hydnomerulius pinastri MD-312 TaxID=994086 RepID=A0A0C9VNH6_9AGAM|nr:hypothetical protein HYDPIDRAFT_33467 [Hydnomerulius pinastri MD-312]